MVYSRVLVSTMFALRLVPRGVPKKGAISKKRGIPRFVPYSMVYHVIYHVICPASKPRYIPRYTPPSTVRSLCSFLRLNIYFLHWRWRLFAHKILVLKMFTVQLSNVADVVSAATGQDVN